MTPQEEFDSLLAKEQVALNAGKGLLIGLGAAAKLYTSYGGNLDNLQRLIALLGIINAQQTIDSTPDLPGPDNIERPLITKIIPLMVPKLIEQLFTKYVPRS